MMDAFGIAVELSPVVLTLLEGRRVTVVGEATGTPELWVTPAIGQDGRYAGHWTLTHKPTGLRLIASDRPSFLRDVAGQLHNLDWAFDSRDAAPVATQESAKRVLALVICDAYRYDEDEWGNEL
jgi:hypothetical protein